MIRFGAVNIDVSHPKAFAQELEKGTRGRYTAVYNDGFREADEVEAFSKKHNLKICKTLEELCDEVDIAFIHSCNWDKHLEYAKVFAKKGKLCFIDKPIVGNMSDLRELLKLVNDGAPIIGTSALRYCDEVINVKNKMKEQGTRAIHVDVSVGVDEFNYAVHAVEEICAIIDDIPISCTFVAAASTDVEHCETYLIRFKNGQTACYHSLLRKFAMFNTIVLTANAEYDTDYCFTVDNGQIYRAMLDTVCDYVEGKENLIPDMETLAYPIKIMLAGKASKERNGITVNISDSILDEISFDGNKFEQEYSKKANKIFL